MMEQHCKKIRIHLADAFTQSPSQLAVGWSTSLPVSQFIDNNCDINNGDYLYYDKTTRDNIIKRLLPTPVNMP